MMLHAHALSARAMLLSLRESSFCRHFYHERDHCHLFVNDTSIGPISDVNLSFFDDSRASNNL